MCKLGGRDHNATSYSTETWMGLVNPFNNTSAEIITLRAIALKPTAFVSTIEDLKGRDHNATSYSTETFWPILANRLFLTAEIITLRAIALKLCMFQQRPHEQERSRDHNATSYSTETILLALLSLVLKLRRDHNATSYSTETVTNLRRPTYVDSAEIITLRAIALKLFSFLTGQTVSRAEIITLRAIALKQGKPMITVLKQKQRS